MTAIAAGATPRGKVHGVPARQARRVVALHHRVMGRARGAAGEGVSVTVVRRSARGYAAAADMAHRLCARVGVVRVRVGGGDGLVGGCRGHRTRGGNGLAIHCLVAGVGIWDGLGLDLSRVLGDWLVLVLMLMLVLVLMLHLVLRNGLHRHRRTHVHVEG